MTERDDELLDQVEQIMRQADQEAEAREYSVSLPSTVAVKLAEDIGMHGIVGEVYFHPPSDDSEREEYFATTNDPERLTKMLQVMQKLQGDLPIDPISKSVALSALDDKRIVQAPLTIGEMDFINGIVLSDIEYNKKFPVDWFLNRTGAPEIPELREREERAWRDSGLDAVAKAMNLFRNLNQAFVAAGAPSRPSYRRIFEEPQR